jgi:hypothetical protein
MEPAIIGLIGVVIGAAISTGANYLIAVRKEKADERKDNVARAVELKRAARLVENDIAVAVSFCLVVLDKGTFGPRNFSVLSDAWNKEKGILAAGCAYDDWYAVGIAILSLDHLQGIHTIAHADEEAAGDLVQYFDGALKNLRAGRDALRNYTE